MSENFSLEKKAIEQVWEEFRQTMELLEHERLEKVKGFSAGVDLAKVKSIKRVIFKDKQDD
jgi:hypothetical protein